jgi:1-acyl-sn-glycerol-3-phosphate acyltransferase
VRAFDVLSQELPLSELAAIFFPPLMGLELLESLVAGKRAEGGEFHPALPEPDLIEALAGVTDWLARYYFRATVENAQAVPTQGPVLLVGNHSAGLMPFDATFAISKLHSLQGRQRAVYPLVHDYAYLARTAGKTAHRLGVLRATRENAEAVLEAGRILLVYPGGDKDAFRSFRDRHKIILAGRKGFVRLALSQKAPIVPLVSVGLHESMIILSSGEKLARWIGLKKLLRTEVMPFGLSLPWGLAPSFFMFLPLPSKVDMRFGDPILLEGEPEDDEAVDRGYARVHAVMQQLMDELSHGRRLWVGRR